jgi:glycosyltransferase involved in cell wall biosynthesis
MYGIITPLEIVPAGIDITDYSANPPAQLRDRFHIPEGQKILLYVGRLDDENNIKFLLRSLKMALRKNENLHLLIIGRGQQEDLYRKIVKRQSLSDNVNLGGFMPRGELNKIYGACDMFLFPSTSATQAMAVLEAMAGGLPIIAINRLGPSDLVRDNENGYLVPLNEKRFSDSILLLAENEKLVNHFGRASKQIASRFTVRNCVNHLIKTYEKALK